MKAVLTQHTETSAGTVNEDVKTLGQIVAKTPRSLSSTPFPGLAGEELHPKTIGNWTSSISGSQKGLMTAPGFVDGGAVGESLESRRRFSKCPKFYNDFKTIRKSIASNETPWTPPVSLFQSLNEALTMIKEETIREGVGAPSSA